MQDCQIRVIAKIGNWINTMNDLLISVEFTSHMPGWRRVTWGVSGVEWRGTGGGGGGSTINTKA